jgi:para-nitrobenzyl esterase
MKRFTSFLLIALVLLSTIAVSCAPAPVALADPIKIDTGLVSGAVVGEKQDIHVYKGIPFAAPPVGDLRWKPPQPAAPWQGVKECTEFGPAPMGYFSASFPSYSKPSEDCLYLNVWTPAKMTSDRLPVMVWIYGGYFRFGEGSNPGYDGENLAQHGVVVVTFNYRVGPFGFLAHPLLSKESEHNSSGNYGLLDQIAALQWVQKNIAAFGGDPNRVTIFGQSAGATSVICLMASPLTQGLFQRAISESMYESAAWSDIRQNKYGQEPREKVGEQLAKDLGCDTASDPIACMRAKSAQEIIDKGKPPAKIGDPGYNYEPCVDGWVVPDLPLNLFEAGKQQNVPLLIGSTADEWALFEMLSRPTLDGYKAYVNSTFGDKAQQVLAMYPASDDEEAAASEKQVITLFTFTCPARVYAGAMSNVKSPAYFYQFTRVPPGSKIGAFHGLDINYVFGNFRPILSPLKADAYFNDTDSALSDVMMSYWTRFAAAGDPNQEGLTQWPAYDAATGQYLELGDKIEVKSGLYNETCDLFMNTIKEKRGQ